MLVASDIVGVGIEPGPSRTGLRGAGNGRITFCGAQIDQFAKIARTLADQAATVHSDLLIAPASAGVALAAVDEARQYILQRR